MALRTVESLIRGMDDQTLGQRIGQTAKLRDTIMTSVEDINMPEAEFQRALRRFTVLHTLNSRLRLAHAARGAQKLLGTLSR
jgi:hypothetical protein